MKVLDVDSSLGGLVLINQELSIKPGGLQMNKRLLVKIALFSITILLPLQEGLSLLDCLAFWQLNLSDLESPEQFISLSGSLIDLLLELCVRNRAH